MESWDSEKLLMKAKIFIDKANEYDHAAPEFPFYSALSLECLARSALTKIHPALNADPREDVNLLYGFGFSITANPRSLPAHSVYLRLEKIIDGFKKSQREVCEFLALLRNEYIHTASLPYQNLATSKWLPRFYEVVYIFLDFLKHDPKKFLGIEVAGTAEALIKTLNAEIKSAVKQKIAAHAKVYDAKSDEAKQKAVESSEMSFIWLLQDQFEQTCPACKNVGAITAVPFKESKPKYEDGDLTIEIECLAQEFKCPHCDLHLKSLDELVQIDFPTHFTRTQTTSLHDLYEPEHYEEYDNM